LAETFSAKGDEVQDMERAVRCFGSEFKGVEVLDKSAEPYNSK
jgi:hypothetical protein